MQNRKYKINGEDIREVISKEWNLSMFEEDMLNSFMELLRAMDICTLRRIEEALEETTNLKDDTDREELNKLFFFKPWAEREEILKWLRNETTN